MAPDHSDSSPPGPRLPSSRAVRTSYDALPYQSVAFPQTHPDRLATLARMFGLSAPDVTSCRVLELGCASGGNLIPMAIHLPGSEFVGIDLSRRQVDEGASAVDALGLRNIRIEQASILEVDDGWGHFDYLICHGVFSWVETAVQDRILQIAATNLSPDGIAYISYNTYPGWHMRDMVRHMMRYHAGQFAEPGEQVQQARALLAFLASASQGSGPYGELLTREVERLNRAEDSYLFHEHLEQTNSPLYFHQFVERAERAGLLYLSEASVSDMLTSHFPATVAETLERISPDILHLEQYLDFVRNRQFRQTLLVHDDRHPTRALTPEFMRNLMVSSPATVETGAVDLRSSEAIVFTNGSQRATVSLTATKAALSLLSEHWPEAIDVETLCARALERAAPYLGSTTASEAREGIMGDLFGCVMYGMVTLHTYHPDCVSRPSNQPRAHALAAYQAQSGTRVVNAHHQTVDLGRFGAEVLSLCDGRRRTHGILDRLMTRFEGGDLILEQDGHPVTAPDVARTMFAQRLEASLAMLARSAVLTG